MSREKVNYKLLCFPFLSNESVSHMENTKEVEQWNREANAWRLLLQQVLYVKSFLNINAPPQWKTLLLCVSSLSNKHLSSIDSGPAIQRCKRNEHIWQYFCPLKTHSSEVVISCIWSAVPTVPQEAHDPSGCQSHQGFLLAKEFLGLFSKRAMHMCSVTHWCLALRDPMTVAHQAPLSMGFSRQVYWSELPFPPPGGQPNPGIKPSSPVSPALQADSLPPCHFIDI